MDIKGKVAIVTGGAQGIGAALARELAAQGAAHVCVTDLNGDGAAAVAAEIGGSGFAVDVRDQAQIEAMIDKNRGRSWPCRPNVFQRRYRQWL